MKNSNLGISIFGAAILIGCGGGSDNKIDPISVATPASEPQDTADPLYRYQWYLANKGQEVLADTLPTAGIDLDIGSLHKDNIRGAGVQVAVVDEGLEIAHEDLAANIVPNGSMNFLNKSTDTTRFDFKGDHGTAVAGIIAAVGWNGKGGRGVAPEAKLRGFNWLDAQETSNFINSWGVGPSAEADVFNNSWGSENVAPGAVSQSLVGAYESLMRGTRKGKGGIYVKSAGNSFAKYDGDSAPCSDAIEFKLGCVPVNFDMTNSLADIIITAAVNAKGVRSSYSSAGSSVWISGFGGEYGIQKKYNAVDRTSNYFDPAILTTDQSGCEQGYNRNRGSIKNALDTDASTIDNSCNYTATMNGTSAAAPMVSGVAALMLQVNPNLTGRDVKYILATTAKKTDPTQLAVKFRGLTLDPGWSVNKAGHAFSNWYGYGLVDAAEAVKAAKTFVSLPVQQDTAVQKYSGAAVAIPYLNDAGGTASIQIAQNMKIETVQLGLTTTHKNPSNLRVILSSPGGSKSYVLTPFSAAAATPITSAGFSVDFMASNAFLNENSAGEWTLQITDVRNPTQVIGTQLVTWKLRILGH